MGENETVTHKVTIILESESLTTDELYNLADQMMTKQSTVRYDEGSNVRCYIVPGDD